MQRFFAFVSRAVLAAACLALVPLGNAQAVDYPTRQPHIYVGSASASASSSSSKIVRAPATISRPSLSPRRRQTVIR